MDWNLLYLLTLSFAGDMRRYKQNKMDWILTYLLTLSCASPLFAVMIAKQSSTLNYLDPSMTLDGNTSTCARTGEHTYSWYYLDTGDNNTRIDEVIVHGKNMKNVYITVGDNSKTTGSFKGFSGNHQCNNVKPHIPDDTNYPITCFAPVIGRYVTLEMLSEGDTYHQLEICEFNFRRV